MTDRAVSRRALVVGLVGAPLVLAACGGGGASPTSATGSSSQAPAPDDGVRGRCAQAEADLIALYDVAIAQHPDKPELVTIREEHRAHLDAFRAGESGASGTGAPSSASVKDLQRAEQAAADARTTDCVEAGSDSSLARLIALVAASEAAHATALGSL